MRQATYRAPTAPWSATLEDLDRCFDRWGVTEWSVDPPFVTPADQRSHYYDPEQARVTIIWKNRDGIPVKMSVATFDNYQQNFRAAYLNVDSMRMVERRGGEEAMRGAYMALPSPGSPPQRDPYEVLGIRPDAPREIAEAAYKALSKRAHPDAGGSEEAMEELNVAIARVRDERRQQA